jgi:hypothetical protein
MLAAYNYATVTDAQVAEWQTLRNCTITAILPVMVNITHGYDIFCANSTYEYAIQYLPLNGTEAITIKTGGSSDHPPPLLPAYETDASHPTAFRKPYVGKPCHALHQEGDAYPCYVRRQVYGALDVITLDKPPVPLDILLTVLTTAVFIVLMYQGIMVSCKLSLTMDE